MKQEDKDDLRKSLEGLFTEEEILALIEKAEVEGKFDDDKTIDEEDQEKPKEEDVKKAYDEIMAKKTELDKSIEVFFDKFGNIPGFTKPEDPFKSKAIENDIEKAEVNDIEKAFGSKFDEIQKSFESQSNLIDEIKKSMETLSEDVKKVAEAPNPFKSLMGKYQFIEKGDKDGDGKDNLSLSKDKSKVIDLFVKSLDKIENEEDQGLVRNMISDYTISNKTNTTGLNIVKKAMDIDFEK